MGLDNWFSLKSKSNPDIDITLASFRKYYELDEWFMRECEHIGDYLVSVKKEDIEKLTNYIQSIAESLLQLGDAKVTFFDDSGYPRKFHIEYYGNDFDPTDSKSLYAGHKLLRLYITLRSMYELLSENNDDIYITFYSSF